MTPRILLLVTPEGKDEPLVYSFKESVGVSLALSYDGVNGQVPVTGYAKICPDCGDFEVSLMLEAPVLSRLGVTSDGERILDLAFTVNPEKENCHVD